MTTPNPSDRFDPELLSGYVDDELSEEERALVEQRLQRDPEARDLVEELRELNKSIRELPRAELSESMRSRVLEAVDRQGAVRDEQEPQPASPIHVFGEGRGFKRGLTWATAAIAAALVLSAMLPPVGEQGGRDLARNDPQSPTSGQSPRGQSRSGDREQPALRDVDPSVAPEPAATSESSRQIDAADVARDLAVRARSAPAAEPASTAPMPLPEQEPALSDALAEAATADGDRPVLKPSALPQAVDSRTTAFERNGVAAIEDDAPNKQVELQLANPPNSADRGVGSEEMSYDVPADQPRPAVAAARFRAVARNDGESPPSEIPVVRLQVANRERASERFDQLLAISGIQLRPAEAAQAPPEARASGRSSNVWESVEGVLVEATWSQLAQLVAACREDEFFAGVALDRDQLVSVDGRAMAGRQVDQLRREPRRGRSAAGQSDATDSEQSSRHYFEEADAKSLVDGRVSTPGDKQSWALRLSRAPSSVEAESSSEHEAPSSLSRQAGEGSSRRSLQFSWFDDQLSESDSNEIGRAVFQFIPAESGAVTAPSDAKPLPE